jgi:hypothetical protein
MGFSEPEHHPFGFRIHPSRWARTTRLGDVIADCPRDTAITRAAPNDGSLIPPRALAAFAEISRMLLELYGDAPLKRSSKYSKPSGISTP